MRIEVERLIKQAERDLENARKTLDIEAYELAAFVCQQAVEKHLKAAWMVRKREAPAHALADRVGGRTRRAGRGAQASGIPQSRLHHRAVSRRGERRALRDLRSPDCGSQGGRGRGGVSVAQAVDERIARFRREVLPRLVQRYRPARVLVFGSRARGEALKDSDLDVLIVAEAFRGVRWLDRPVRVAEDCDIRFGVELLCYTPDEYERKLGELGIVRTASEEGLELLTV